MRQWFRKLGQKVLSPFRVRIFPNPSSRNISRFVRIYHFSLRVSFFLRLQTEGQKRAMAWCRCHSIGCLCAGVHLHFCFCHRQRTRNGVVFHSVSIVMIRHTHSAFPRNSLASRRQPRSRSAYIQSDCARFNCSNRFYLPIKCDLQSTPFILLRDASKNCSVEERKWKPPTKTYLFAF